MKTQVKPCKKHGEVVHYLVKGKSNSWKCRECNSERVNTTRRNNKTKLVAMFGGECVICGYNRYVGALEFHHSEPEHKDFGLSSRGMTWALSKMIEEAKKCILVCANCHREIHAGLVYGPLAQRLERSPVK